MVISKLFNVGDLLTSEQGEALLEAGYTLEALERDDSQGAVLPLTYRLVAGYVRYLGQEPECWRISVLHTEVSKWRVLALPESQLPH